MRVLWITNACPNFLTNLLNIQPTFFQGWIDAFGRRLCEESDAMAFVFGHGNSFLNTKEGNKEVYCFPRSLSNKSNDCLLKYFSRVLNEFKPDIIHIHGTEFYHSYTMFQAARSAGLEKRVVVSIQGLTSEIEKYYLGDLPKRIVKRFTFGDFVRRLNLYSVQRIYKKRGISEKRLINYASNIIGRTEWDKCHVLSLNETVRYFKCNECLRDCFYYGKWEYSECDKHSIFLSQSSNPLKGMHHAIEALHDILHEYPDAKLYVTGNSVFNIKWFKIDSYHKYIKELIIKYGLREKVVFLGNLSAEEMKQVFLKTNVFILPSSIENSPNSLGEAMILGVPCVVAYVGGVPSIFSRGDGFYYQYNDPCMLSFYIKKVFESKDCSCMTESSRKHAKSTHNVNNNYSDLLNIYKAIMEQ